MPRPASDQPTEVELQILNVLWDHGPSTVREIHNQLSQHKDTNYSTTVKMLSVMLDKGLVVRDENSRPQVYRTAATRQKTQKRMLGELLDKVYDGSSKTLMLHALSSKKASADELAEIRRMLDEMEGKP